MSVTRAPGDFLREIQPVNRVDEREASGDLPNLVALQRPDQVPVDGHGSTGILLLECFLDSILANGIETGHRGRSYRIRTMRLGDRNNAHRMRPAASKLPLGDDRSYPGQPPRKSRIRHNQQR